MAVILVTGGAGYIGSHACKALAAAGHTPVVFDNLSTGWRAAVKFGPFHAGDLRDPKALDLLFSAYDFDAVMHFAALSDVGESSREPGLYYANNVGGTLGLLEAMRRHGVDKLVFSSTCAIYGAAAGDLLTEDDAKAPISPYGHSKLMVETIISDFETRYGLNAVFFRYFNVAGADPQAEIGENHRPETHLVPIVIEAATGLREKVIVFGDDYPTPDGTCVRDYIHVSDLIEAHLLGMDYLIQGGGGLRLNLGSGRGFSVREIINSVGRVTGQTPQFEIGPRRAGDAVRLVSGSAQALEVLGWRPSRSTLDLMIEDAWRWSQRGGYPEN